MPLNPRPCAPEQHQQKPFSQIAQQHEQQRQVFPNQPFDAADFPTDCAAAGRTVDLFPQTYFREVPDKYANKSKGILEDMQ
jgi:hypothetical protein